MKSSSRRILAAAFPKMTRADVQAWGKAMKIDDASTISRSQLLIDAALCKYWARLWSTHGHLGDSVLYMWADSSPQFGVDWLLTVVLCIHASDMDQCVQADKYIYIYMYIDIHL